MAEFSRQKLYRSFSSSNLHATNRIHDYVSDQERNQDITHNLTREVTKSSMIIPTFNRMFEYHPDLPGFLVNLIVNKQVLHALEQAKLINWCDSARSLVPLNTDSDGSCLLHAISMYIFGVHDRRLTLRRFVYRKLVAENRFYGKLYVRWKYEQELVLREVQNDFNSGEMRRDWDTIVQAASAQEYPNGNQGQKYAQLEDIHIFTACVILARPIIVICDKVHRSMDGRSLQPSRMGGIYLPVLRDPSECEKTPIIVCYWQNHFMPLLNGEDRNLIVTQKTDHPDAQLCIPLVYQDMTRMPVRFLLGHEIEDDLLNTYLDCVNIPFFNERKQEHGVLGSILKFKPPPAWSVELMWSLFSHAKDTFSSNLSQASPTGPQPALFGDTSQTSSQTAMQRKHPNQTDRFQDRKTLSSSVSSPLQSPTYSQPPTSPTRKEKQQTFDYCKRMGCRSMAKPYLDGLCEKCHKDFMEPVRKERLKYDTTSKETLSNVPTQLRNQEQSKYVITNFKNIPPRLHSSDQERSEVLFEKPAVKTSFDRCLNVPCKNVGIQQFHGFCKSCYTRDIVGSPIADSVSFLAGASEPYDMPNALQDMPKNESRKVSNNEQAIGLRNAQRNDVRSEVRNELKKEHRNQNKAEDKSVYDVPKPPRPAKIFCAEPGCQEQPLTGCDSCQYHLNVSKPDCMTEGCRNKAVDKEVPLCEKCKREQLDAASIAEPTSSRQERQERPIFEAPNVYPTFGEPRYRMSPSADQTPAAEPSWQQGYRRSSAHNTAICRESGCGHLAAADKHGLCNDCFLSKTILNERENRLKERKCHIQGCQRPAEARFGLLCEVCYNQKNGRPWMNTPPISPSRPIDHGVPGNVFDKHFPELPKPSDIRKPPTTQSYDLNQPYQSDTENPYSVIPPRNVSVGTLGESPPLPPRNTQSTSTGYINLAYEPGVYSTLSFPGAKKCIMDTCKNTGKDAHNGLCDTCYQQSLKQEELLRTEMERKMQQQSPVRAHKLPADSPYLNPVPCKTVGCPRTGIRAYEDLCAVCHDKELERNYRASATSQPIRNQQPTIYGGAMDSGSMQPPAPRPRQDQQARQETFRRKQSQECATPGCSFFASPEYGAFCSKCFLDKTKSDTGGRDSLGEHQRSPDIYTFGRGPAPSLKEYKGPLPSLLGNEPCRKSGCKMFGRPEQDGYCSKCYY